MNSSYVVLPDVLTEMIQTNRLPHSLLLENDDDFLLENIAKTIAATINCKTHRSDINCTCSVCHRILANSYPDVIMLNGAEDKKAFSKENIKEVVFSSYVSPVEADVKFYLFVHVDEMTPECQSLLLKLTEDPPENTCIILCVNNRFRLLSTLLSRLTLISLPSHSEQALKETAKSVDEAVSHCLNAYNKQEGFELLVGLSCVEKDRAAYLSTIQTLLTKVESPVHHLSLLQALSSVESNSHLPLVSSLLAQHLSNNTVFEIE